MHPFSLVSTLSFFFPPPLFFSDDVCVCVQVWWWFCNLFVVISIVIYMFSQTRVHRIGTLSTVLANAALYFSHVGGLQTPGAALVLAGCFFRCLTLPCTIYGDQCLRRAACAYPELHDAHQEYLSIVEHPQAIMWEKRVAAQKLKNDRERIFRSYRTNNLKMFTPHMVAAAASLYCLGVPAQQIGAFFIQDAGLAIVSPLAVSYVAATPAAAGHFAWTSALGLTTTTTTTAATTTALFTIDPTLALAAALTYFNVCQHLQQRTGFNTRLDGWIHNVRHVALGSVALVAAGSLLSGPLAYALATPALHFFPPYLAPVWLGMSATTAVKSVIAHTAPGRALFRLPAYPPQHGTYGEESTAAGHEYRLAFTGVDAEETQHVWQTQKRILDYECDIRIHQWLTRLGLFDDLDELAYESEQLQRKRAVAHKRRLAREAEAASAKAKEASAVPQDGMTEAARRRYAMRHGEPAAAVAGASAKDTEAASEELKAVAVDRIQAEESKRRHDIRVAREAAWKKNHS